MKILIDTNVIIDFYQERQPFLEAAERTLMMCTEDGCEGMLCASSLTDIYDLLRKSLGAEAARGCIKKLLEVFSVAEVGKAEIHKAAKSKMQDFEDAVVAFSAKGAKAHYIVTRNTGDYEDSPVPAITPQAFIDLKPDE